MRKYLDGLKANHLAVALAALGLCNVTIAGAETEPDFTNPAVGMSSQAVIASGACIARYTVILDAPWKPAGLIGRQIAKALREGNRSIRRIGFLDDGQTGRVCEEPEICSGGSDHQHSAAIPSGTVESASSKL